MKIKFLGATGTVTGSRYLLEYRDKKILVDCGLFQGYKELRLRNWEAFPVDPATIDAVILTHAHIDHSGYLPVLVKNGFHGKIISTPGTQSLCQILLPDSGHLQEEEAKYANKFGYSKHKPALPLYTQKEAIKTLPYFSPIVTGKRYTFADDFSFYFRRAGHIVGACSVVLQYGDKTIALSGDVGRMHDPLMVAPRYIRQANYWVIESTYGDRLHENSDPERQLQEIIQSTIQRGGTVVIPAFAVGRTQLLLYYIYQLLQKKAIPEIPVYLDSPTALGATETFCRYTRSTRFSKELARAMCSIAQMVHTPDESKYIDTLASPKIIISASGMATGGRVLHHLRVFLPDEKNTVLLTGYQTAGTRGARLQAGEPEIKLLGERVPVRARVETLLNVSAHADYEELLAWVAHDQNSPTKVFITHGELSASLAFKKRIEERLQWNCLVPAYLHEEEI